MTERIDEFWEQDDLDGGIQQKQELIEEVKNFPEDLSAPEAIRQLNQIKKKWRRIPGWESSYEEELEIQFNEYVDVIQSKLNSRRDEIKAAKEDIVQRAKEAAQSNDFRAGAAAMDTLMDEWKAAGSAGKPADDELWQQFKDARQLFYDRRRQNYKDKVEQFAQIADVKKGLIEEARELLSPDNWNVATNKMNDIMNRWKEAGSAGRDNEPSLWEEFSTIRKQFYDGKSAYFEQVRTQQNENLSRKKEIVEEARTVLANDDYSRASIDEMKNFSVRWKEIGYGGKNEEPVWKEFRSIADQYFDQLKDYRDQQHQNWVDRMEDSKDRKKELIDDQKRQIRRLEDELNGLISQNRAEQIDNLIADKEDFIKRLEQEIDDIDRKLSE